jgi:predicted  nucleic acid-binding Zn-ribbon protein
VSQLENNLVSSKDRHREELQKRDQEKHTLEKEKKNLETERNALKEEKKNSEKSITDLSKKVSQLENNLTSSEARHHEELQKKDQELESLRQQVTQQQQELQAAKELNAEDYTAMVKKVEAIAKNQIKIQYGKEAASQWKLGEIPRETVWTPPPTADQKPAPTWGPQMYSAVNNKPPQAAPTPQNNSVASHSASE